MNPRLHLILACVALGLGASALSAGAAHAGIIVTVGKPVPEGDLKARTTTTTTSTAPTTQCTTDKTGVTTCSKKTDPATGLPVDWKCVPIGGGLLYCEGPGAGAGADEGGAGYWDGEDYEDEALDEPGDEIEALGCSSGAGPDLVAGLLGAFGLLGALGLRRRR